MKLTESNKYHGFTLIELLVVIAIISLLSSIVLASLAGAREGARDVRRKQDLRQIQQALEMHYNDYGEYPDCNQYIDDPNSGCLQNALIGNGYMQKMPVDPKYGNDGTAAWGYDYNYNTSNKNNYKIRTILEGKMERTHNYPNGSQCQSSQYPTCGWFENRCVYVSEHGDFGPCEAYWFQLGVGD